MNNIGIRILPVTNILDHNIYIPWYFIPQLNDELRLTSTNDAPLSASAAAPSLHPFFSRPAESATNKITAENARAKLLGLIKGLIKVDVDGVGYILLIFENASDMQTQLSHWAGIEGVKKAVYPYNCIEISKHCDNDILDTLLAKGQLDSAFISAVQSLSFRLD